MIQWRKPISVAMVALMVAGLSGALAFSLSTKALPWFDPMLTIDGYSYLAGMESISDHTGPLALADTYHSPGYQIYLSVFYAALQSVDGTVLAAKRTAWAFHLLCVGMVVFIGIRRFSLPAGLLAGVFVAFSHSLASYTNLIQYEMPLTFLLLAHTLGLLTAPTVERRLLRGVFYFLLGVTAAAAILIQDRFIFLVPLGAYCLGLTHRDARRLLLAYLIPAVLLVGGWSAYQTRRTGQPTLVSTGSSFRYSIHNNPNAVGAAFPYVEPAEPSGLRFVISRPGRYAWLIKERFLYLWDLKTDLWYLGVPWLKGRAAAGFHVLVFLLFWAGFALKFRSDARLKLLRGNAALYLTLICSLAGPLLVLSSSRYNVPLIPILALFQADALLRAAAFCRAQVQQAGPLRLS